MKSKLLLLLFLASLSTYAQYTLIPDVQFENRLIELGIDKDGKNGKVLTSNISSVTSLDISWNNISDLTGIQDFTSLSVLDCKLNNLTQLNLNSNNKLTVLDCRGNNLTSLDLSKLPLLSGILCSENSITSLDVSKNPILRTVFCSKNNLINLNLKNGNNTNFQDILCDFRFNPLLSCIQVDNPSYSSSNWTNFKDNNTIYSNTCDPAYTVIPDVNFENKLISLGIDKDGKNGKVLTSSIISLTSLDVSNSLITDLTGIENFLNLTNLNVSNNKLTLLNLISQKKIKSLDCSNNSIKVLDLYENNLLVTLNFSNNQLSELDLWRQSALVTLKGASNKLTTLATQGLNELKTIEVDNNQLANLYISENKSLSVLRCNNNLLTALDVSQNSALISLFCANNQIIKLNIASNLNLRDISCENNALISLNLKNGKNNLFTTYDFRNNNSLICIEVDDETYSVINWSAKKDSTTNYNVFCGPFTLIPDTNFENKLIALGIDTDGKNGKILTSSISNLNSIDLSNSSIYDLNGIQDFTNLSSLDVSGNQLIKLEIKNNKSLRILNCSNNQIEVLNVVVNTKLTDFFCNNNNLNSLNIKNGYNSQLVNFDFRNNSDLTCILVDNESYANSYWTNKKDATANFLPFCGAYTLIPDYNFENKLIELGIDYDGKNGKVLTSSIEELTTLNLNNENFSNKITDLTGIQDFKKLVHLDCTNNQISTLDLSKNTDLETLNCSGNLITSLDLSQNLKLITLIASGCRLSNIDISKSLLLTNIDISINQLKDLSVKVNTALTDLNCGFNQITNLDVSQNTVLKSLGCHNNALTILDLSNNLSLEKIKCTRNRLTNLNFDNNIALTDIDCSFNTISSISVHKNSNLVNFYCENTNVETIDLKNGSNTKIINLSLISNPELYCIQVDSKKYSDEKWSDFKDSWISFYENCSQTISIPDVNFENKLISLGIDRDGQNGKVYAVLIYDIKNIDLSGSNISSLSGIEYFENLTDLNCDFNNLTSLNVSNNKLLESLNCNQNKINTLDISNNKMLVTIYCAHNNLTTLNVANGNNANFNNNFTFGRFPDFSNNPNLTCINVDNVDFSNVNWSGSKDPFANYSKSCGSTIDIQDVNLEQKLVNLGIDKDGINGIMLKSEAINVTSLDLSSSNITNLSPLEYFANLQTLNCSGNQIQELRLQYNSKLTVLNCSNNNLAHLDLTKNLLLTSLNCNNNKLIDATIKNGRNNNIISVNFSNNNNLSCIEVDNATVFNTIWSMSKDNTATYSDSCGLYTLIPDENFEYRLIALGIDTDGKNGKVLTENISNISDLSLTNGQIKDATGIQDFVSLTTLHINKNLLTRLNLEKNTALENIYCEDNKLPIIDLSSNVKLTRLNLDNNLLTNLDLTNNVELTDLSCNSNQLTSLNFSKCIALTNLTCSKNKLTELVIPLPNSSLETLYCDENSITSLTVSNLRRLTTLNCSKNKLISLILPENNDVLIDLNCSYNNLSLLSFYKLHNMKFLNCSNNQLSELSVSNFNDLEKLVCSYNKLKKLNLSSKDQLTQVYADHNELYSLDFSNPFYYGGPDRRGDITNNPDLKCIQVNHIYDTTDWPLIKDEQSYYSEDCQKFTIIDSTFEDKLIALGIDKDGKNEKVLTESIASLTTLDISNSAITSLKGIKDFTALEELNCNGNQLKYLDISNNKFLKALDCSNNQLTRLNLKNGNNKAMDGAGLINNYTNNPALNCILVENQAYSTANWTSKKDSKTYYAEDCTSFTLIPDYFFEKELIDQGIDIDGISGKVDTSRIDTVEYLDLWNSNITDLTGIQDFTALKYLSCRLNNLTVLDLSKNTALINLSCDENKLQTLDVSKNTALTYLNCSFNSLQTLDVSKNTALTDLKCSHNVLQTLDVSTDIALINLACAANRLTNLNVSNNPNLSYLYCTGNYLTSLNLSKNLALYTLYCSINQLTSLNITKNTALNSLDCQSNQLTSIDISTNVFLTSLHCNDNKLVNLNLKNGQNIFLNYYGLDFRNNPKLRCIQVDNPNYSNTKWKIIKDDEYLSPKDAIANYSDDCDKPLVLPSNNFAIETKSESCTNLNNGEISITATATYNYIALINGQSYNFENNSLKLNNLSPGTYSVSITIQDEKFEQDYTVVIAKGANVTGKSSVMDNKVAVEITKGTAPYTVFLDGIEQFETTKSSFSVETKKGGLLQVKTAKACEGIYAVAIAGLEGTISAYPNPTSGSFEIELPTSRKEVLISLYTLDGKLISTKKYTVENGKVQLSLEKQPAGLYVAKIELDTPDYLKIIKN